MAVLVALFLLIAIILMLVLLEKNTGGNEGGVGCVSGAILFAVFLLVMSRSQELKNQGKPNPISTVEAFLNALPTFLAWLVGLLLAICVLGGLGYLVCRLRQREVGRNADRDFWMDLLAPLGDDDFDAAATANQTAINAAFRSDDWIELRRRRHGVLSPPPTVYQDSTDWGRLADLAQWSPLVLIAAALLWQLGLGISKLTQSGQGPKQIMPKAAQTRTNPERFRSAPGEKTSPADWMERYGSDPRTRQTPGRSASPADWMRGLDQH